MEHWYVWLFIAAVSFIYLIFNQISRMRRMSRSPMPSGMLNPRGFDSTSQAFFKGTAGLAIAGVIAWVSGILLAISIVLNIIQFVQKG